MPPKTPKSDATDPKLNGDNYNTNLPHGIGLEEEREFLRGGEVKQPKR